jgi:hypothetical protein
MFAALALVAMLAPACADARRAGDHPTPPPDGDPRELVLRWGSEGGLTPPEHQLVSLPSFSLYGDGTIVRPGPQIEIYPPPALPALESFTVDRAGIDAIVDAAFEAGLDSVPDLTDMGSVGIADAPETVFTLHARGVDRTVRVYALMDVDPRPPGMSDEEYAARRSLLDLIDALGSLERWLPEGSVSRSRTYRPAGSRVFVSPYRGDPDLTQPEIAWPLADPLERIGEDTGTGFRCAVVTGSDWADLLAPAVRTANQLTPWTSEGRRYAVAFRPLLPDESGC